MSGKNASPARGKVLENKTYRSVGKLFAFLMLATLAAVGLWLLLGWALSSERGFELTDEGLYLLGAREVAGQSQWGFPSGWHTAPFYSLAGADVANFRTLGALVLTLCGALFGLSAFVALNAPGHWKKSISSRQKISEASAFALVGFGSTLFLYHNLLRAPSYNWVNLVGILIAASGVFWWFYHGRRKAHAGNGSWAYFPAASSLVSFGLVFSVVGKPTSPFLLMGLTGILGVWLFGVLPTLRFAVAVFFSTLAWVAVLVISGLWPLNFLQFFTLPLGTPGLTATHGLPSAMADLLRSPVTLLELTIANRIGGATLLTGLLLIVLSRLSKRFSRMFRISGMSMSVFSAAWSFGMPHWVGLESLPQYQFSSMTLVSALTLLIGALALAVPLSRKGWKANSVEHWPLRFAVILLAVWIPFVFGFGHSGGVVSKASLALVGISIATLAALSSAGTPRGSRFALSAALAFTLMATVAVADSHRAPYRMEAMSKQNTEVTLLDRAQSVLLVDPETASEFRARAEVLAQHGFKVGDPLIGMEWRWNASWPYALGADVPPTLMPSLWGYENSLGLLRSNLSRPDSDDFPWSDAWWMITRPKALTVEQQETMKQSYEIVGQKAGKAFPADFTLVGEVGDVQIYKPHQ